MKRKMWTDERIKDRFDSLDRSLERVDRDIRDLRTLMVQLWGSTIVGSLGIIATLVATQ
ncbi:MAG TPA: hypothetical protein VD761_03555 [Solirubrobacterales bacterium]|nr:hypothetical protein [Solirubrobacterales bacterium]